MPPKAKAKPKPQPRRVSASTAISTTGDTSTNPVDIDTLKASKPEPFVEKPVSLPNVQTTPSTTTYEAASLFIEDRSDTASTDERNEESSTLTQQGRVEGGELNDEDFRDDLEDDELANSDDNDEDNDPVVQSYDIIINNTLKDMMYLFQYPVRNKAQPYTLQEGFAPLEARMKVNSGVMELDIPINVDRNYDEQKGILYGEALHKSQMQKSLRAEGQFDAKTGENSATDRRKRRRTAEDDNGQDEADIPTPEHLIDFQEAKRKNRVLNKQILSAKMQQDDANYFIGLFQGDKLHFTRLHRSLQLRPQFHHIDVMTEQERANQKARRETNNPNPAKPVEARAVNLSVKTASGDNRTLTAAEHLAKDLRQEEDEQWREIEWIDQDDDEAWQMFANVHKQTPIPLNNTLTKEEYFNWCCVPNSAGDGLEGIRGFSRRSDQQSK